MKNFFKSVVNVSLSLVLALSLCNTSVDCSNNYSTSPANDIATNNSQYN